MIILGIRVTDVNTVMTQYDIVRVYRESTQEGPYDEVIGTVPLVAGQMDYEYTDTSGDDTSWYSASYFHTTTPQVESDLSLPFKGIPLYGPLGLLTPDYIRANTDFPALAAMSDTKLWNYIWRAESLMMGWAAQYGGFCPNSAANWDVMSRIAALMVVEQLFITQNPAARAQRVSGMESERIGTYSYKKASGSSDSSSQYASDPYAFGAEATAIMGYYTCGTSSLIHMKTTRVFYEFEPIAGDPLTPQSVGVEVRPWHDFTDLQLRRGILVPGGRGPIEEQTP